MTLVLQSGLEAKTLPSYIGSQLGGEVRIGDTYISLKDFLTIAHYVLVISELEPDDPRRQFVKCVQEMKEVPGYNGGSSVRFFSPLEPVDGMVAPFA